MSCHRHLSLLVPCNLLLNGLFLPQFLNASVPLEPDPLQCFICFQGRFPSTVLVLDKCTTVFSKYRVVKHQRFWASFANFHQETRCITDTSKNVGQQLPTERHRRTLCGSTDELSATVPGGSRLWHCSLPPLDSVGRRDLLLLIRKAGVLL